MWSPTTSPNLKSVDLFQSSPPQTPKIKNSRAGKGKSCKKPPSISLVESSAASQPSLPPLPALSKSPEGEHEDSPYIPPRRTREKADLFRHTVQSIFPRIPFRFAAIQVCSAQLFSLKYPTLQREKKILSAAVTQAKNNPFLVNKMSFASKSAPAFAMQLPLFYLFKT